MAPKQAMNADLCKYRATDKFLAAHQPSGADKLLKFILQLMLLATVKVLKVG